MKKAFCIITTLIFIIGLFVSPSSALTYSGLFSSPTKINYIDDSTYLVVDGDDLVYFYPEGAGSTSAFVNNITYLQDAIITPDDELIIIINPSSGDGFVYLMDVPTGLHEWEDISDQALTVGVIPEGTESVIVDEDGDIYVLNSGEAASGNVAHSDLWQIQHTVYTQSMAYESFEAEGLGTKALCLAGHPTKGLLISHNGYAYGGTWYARIYNWDGSLHTLYQESFSGTGYVSFYGVKSTTNGDIYFTQDHQGTYTINRLNASDSYTIETVASLSASPRDLEINSQGIMYVCFPSAGTIISYATPTGLGGFDMFADSSSSSDDTSSTDNPLLNLDSPEDAKEVATNYSGITWILLIGLFLMAAMGGKN